MIAGLSGAEVLKGLLASTRVLPVVAVDDARDAVPLARALLGGGLNTIEIVLRTRAAIDAIERIVGEVEGMVVGAGTVRTAEDVNAVKTAGARFAVSPGLTPNLVHAVAEHRLPLIPGIATPSEAMAAADLGFVTLKLFPAKVVGGVAMLRALSGPLPDISFCPTGGVDADSAAAYLELPNVVCVGGSWLVPKAMLDDRAWSLIEEHVRRNLRALGGLDLKTGDQA